jgi:hypothetical protein
MKVTKHKKNLTFEDQKPQGSSGSTSNYWMWSCNNYTLYNKILNKIIKNYELDKLKTKEPISIKIKSQNANLWSFQTKDPHKHYTETWNHPNNAAYINKQTNKNTEQFFNEILNK